MQSSHRCEGFVDIKSGAKNIAALSCQLKGSLRVFALKIPNTSSLPHISYLCILRIVSQVSIDFNSQLTNDASDTFQKLLKFPIASTPAAPSQAQLRPRTTKSGWPVPVSIGNRRAACRRPNSSKPHMTSSSLSSCKGLKKIAPRPSWSLKRRREPSALWRAMPLPLHMLSGCN